MEIKNYSYSSCSIGNKKKKPSNNQYHKVRKMDLRGSCYPQMFFPFSHYCTKLLTSSEEEKNCDKTQVVTIFNISTALSK